MGDSLGGIKATVQRRRRWSVTVLNARIATGSELCLASDEETLDCRRLVLMPEVGSATTTDFLLDLTAGRGQRRAAPINLLLFTMLMIEHDRRKLSSLPSRI